MVELRDGVPPCPGELGRGVRVPPRRLWERARTPIQQLLEVQGQLERLRTNTDTTVALYSTYDIQLKRVSVCHSTILIQLRLWLNPQPLAQSVS